MVHRVIAKRAGKVRQESGRVSVRDGVRYEVQGTVPVLGTSRDIGAYIGDARVEIVIRHAGELLTDEGASRIEIIVTKPAR